MILSSKTRYETFKHIGCALDSMVSVISPLLFVALIGIASVWAVETPPVQTIINPDQVISTHSQSTIDVPVVISGAQQTKRAVYQMWLTDEHGTMVYVFPSHYVRSLASRNLRGSDIKLPQLDNGTYQLHLEIVYQFNPFKNGSLDMVAATLNIKN